MSAVRDHFERLPRVPFERPLRIREGGRVVRLKAENLSLGGMFVQAEQPLDVGARIKVSLESREQALLLGEAEVVWRRSGSYPGEGKLGSHGFGLRFLNLEPTAQSLVEAVVRHGGTSQFQWGRSLDPEEPTRPDHPAAELPPEPKTDPSLN